jgi:hypothetical protein
MFSNAGLIAAVTVLILLTACSSGFSLYSPPYSPIHPKAAETAFLVNCQRERRGLPPLEWDHRLYEIALAHAIDMGERAYFSHYSPEGQGPADRLMASAVFFRRLGENLAAGDLTPRQVQSYWLRSPDHKRNLTSVLFTHHAVAYDSVSHNWTHIFANLESNDLAEILIRQGYFRVNRLTEGGCRADAPVTLTAREVGVIIR